MKRLAMPIMALAIFLLNILLNAPLFMTGDLPFPGRIEGGYVGMARFISQHPNPWGWNPFSYCGLPTQFIYVPLVPYISALFIRLLPAASPDTVYRSIVSLMTCLGPVTLFFFALYFTRSRRWSFTIAIAYSLLSLSYTLFPAVDNDRGVAQLAWHVKVLAKYGEGPHNSGLTILPLALLAVWIAATGRSYSSIFVAAVLLAIMPLTNWVAAFGLAISVVLLALAAWGEPEFQLNRMLAAAGLAYLLACFWLTPSYITNIVLNWPVDSYGYKVQERQTLSLAGLAVCVVVVRLVFRFLGGSFYYRFITLAVFAFGWIASMYYLCGVDTIPESHRYAIEFELFAALAIVESLRLTLRNPNSTVRLCAIGTAGVMLLVGAPQLWAYLTQGWAVWAPSPPENSIEYKIADWIAQHPPTGRVFATGEMRYRLNSWFDIPQVGGGFETGLTNRVPVDLAYHVRVGGGPWKGHDTEETLLELKSLGAEYLVVHGAKSREFYRDFAHPERISSILEPVFHIEDDTVYRVPFRSLAHTMRPEELPQADVAFFPQSLVPFVAATEDPARPLLSMHWKDTNTLEVAGAVPPSNWVAVQVSYDAGWHATQDGHFIEVDEDRLGQIVLHALPSAATHIELRYNGTFEQRIMGTLSGIAWIGAIAMLFESKRKLEV